MIKLLPKEYYPSIYKINYKKLKEVKIKCLLFDLDNTCLPYKEKEPSSEFQDLIKELVKMNFNIIIFTNASKRRTIPFSKININCHYSSKKPFKHNFNKILKKYNYKKEEVAIIGDQLFTDILGGNRVGIHTILVDPLSKQDFLLTKILRGLETILIYKYTKKGLFKKGEYYEK